MGFIQNLPMYSVWDEVSATAFETEVYLGPCQISMMEILSKKV